MYTIPAVITRFEEFLYNWSSQEEQYCPESANWGFRRGQKPRCIGLKRKQIVFVSDHMEIRFQITVLCTVT